jgi:hypothetical protein
MKCALHVVAGVCGFTTDITADAPDDQMVTLKIETDCQKIAGLAELLRGKEIDAYQEVGAGSGGVVLSQAGGHLAGCCAACVVPPALFKAVQVAARVALPAAISITMRAD